MKKNKLMLTAAIVGSVLLITSVVAFAAGGSGYENYKKAVKGLLTLDNATISADVELKDNGEIILSGDSVWMADNLQSGRGNAYVKSSFVLDGKTHVMESSSVGNFIITNTDGEYTSFTAKDYYDPDDEMEFDEDSNTAKLMELLVDTLVGDVKNQFVKSGDAITVNLQGAQIPELARLGISATLEATKSASKSDIEQDSIQALFDRMPQLNAVDVKSLSMTATTENGILKSNDCKAVITGTDAKGVYHELEITMNMSISNIGSTVVKSIDTTGKDVKDVNYFDADEISITVKNMYESGASESDIQEYVIQMQRDNTGNVFEFDDED